METIAIGRVSQALCIHEAFYKEKSMNQWLKLGDRCTHFFHILARINAARSNITSMVINNVVVEHEYVIFYRASVLCEFVPAG